MNRLRLTEIFILPKVKVAQLTSSKNRIWCRTVSRGVPKPQCHTCWFIHQTYPPSLTVWQIFRKPHWATAVLWVFLSTFLEELILHSVHPHCILHDSHCTLCLFSLLVSFSGQGHLPFISAIPAPGSMSDGGGSSECFLKGIFSCHPSGLCLLWCTQILLITSVFLPQFYSEDRCPWPSSSGPQALLPLGWRSFCPSTGGLLPARSGQVSELIPLPFSKWGPAACCHPLGKIPEAKVWW